MQGKSDLHVHFHGDVAAGASLHLHVPSVNGIKTQIDQLREALLSRRQLSQELSAAIHLLSSKVTAVDDVVLDQPLNPVPAE